MPHICLVPFTLDVAPLARALDEHPELWDQNTARTESPDSPHHGLSDIWVRFADPATMQPDGSHDSIWYPPAKVLPVRELVFPIMAAVRGERLGGVLITRIRAGQQCRPHTDPGWHARYYDKFALQVASAPGQAFHFHEESLSANPGQLYWFDNAYEHWVTNNSSQDRITLISCIRTERN